MYQGLLGKTNEPFGPGFEYLDYVLEVEIYRPVLPEHQIRPSHGGKFLMSKIHRLSMYDPLMSHKKSFTLLLLSRT